MSETQPWFTANFNAVQAAQQSQSAANRNAEASKRDALNAEAEAAAERDRADELHSRMIDAQIALNEERLRANEAESKLSDMKRKFEAEKRKANQATEKNTLLEKALREKTELVIEWMHGHEAFKRLARDYGKRLGVTDEQLQKDYDQYVLDCAEEHALYQNTSLKAKTQTRLSQNTTNSN